MSALDDGEFGFEPVTDLAQIARDRKGYLEMGFELPLQEAERAAGITEDDIRRRGS